MNGKQAKKLRKQARKYTEHLPDTSYQDGRGKKLGECTRGAYQALKLGRVKDQRNAATM